MSNYLMDLFKEMYYYELERKDNLNSKLGIPITVFTLMIGAVFYLVSNIYPLESKLWLIIFWLLFCILIISLVRVTYFLAKAYYGYEYGYVPKPDEILQYQKRLKKFYKENGLKDESEMDIYDLMVQEYSECTKLNTENNEQKASFTYKAVRSLVLSLILLGIFSMLIFISLHQCPK